MQLIDIERTVYDRLNYDYTPGNAIFRRIRRHINLTHRAILRQREFSVLRKAVLTTTSVANSPYMVLPQAATKIHTISDRLNNRNLDVLSLKDIRYRDPGLKFSGAIPDAYAVLNWSARVAMDPSTADKLYVVSDNVLDGAGVKVYIEGTITGGLPQKSWVTMNGLTAVQCGPSTWEHISKFYLTAPAAGTVTLKQTSSVGTELARIVAGRSSAMYTSVHLTPTPSSAFTYYCDVDLYVSDMEVETDEPLVPDDYADVLIWGAMRMEYLNKEKLSEYGVATTYYKDALSELSAYIRSRGGVSVFGQRSGQNRQFSQLGAYYPSGS